MTREVLERECTLSWGRDVARMIARLLGNQAAYGEDLNVSTSKHQPWAEVLDNSKVLAATGMRESELAGIGEGLAHELERFLRNPSFPAGVSAYAQGAGSCMRPSGVARHSGGA